jgi:hypothetical protein
LGVRSSPGEHWQVTMTVGIPDSRIDDRPKFGGSNVRETPMTGWITLITLVVVVVVGAVGAWGLSSVAGKFGDRFLRTVVVDECLAGGGGRDQCGDGGVVQRARQAEAGFVQPSDGVIGELSRAVDYAEQSAPLQLGRGSHTGSHSW